VARVRRIDLKTPLAGAARAVMATAFVAISLLIVLLVAWAVPSYLF
jgi:hypothetical protein